MNTFIEIRCQKQKCPYGKKNCCFGEISKESLVGREIVERHKCSHAKNKENKYVTVVLSA